MAEESYLKLARTENVKRNVAFGLLSKAVSLLAPFVVRTVLIYRFGAGYLGLNSVFSSILQVLNLAELGFGTAVSYSLYRPIAEKDTETICAYLYTFRKIYRVVGAVILALGLLVMPILPLFIKDTVIPGGLNIYLWFLIFLGDSVISYLLFGYKTCLPSAFQRGDLLSKADMLIMVLKSAFQTIVLLFSSNFYLYLLAFPAFTVIRNAVVSVIVSNRFPEYSCKGRITAEQKADLKKRVSGLLIFKLCITSRNGIDSVCISAFIGLTVTGMYNSYYYIMNTLVGISMILCGAMIPGIGNSIVTETREKNYKDMRRFNFMYMLIAGWASACLLCLCQPFVRVWLGEALMLEDNVVFALCAYFYLLKMGDMRWVYSEGAGLWWECRYYMFAEAALNIVLNIVLVQFLGVFGIVLATVISVALVNFIGCSHVAFKHYFKNGKLGEFYADHFKYLAITVLASGLSFWMCGLFPAGMNRWAALFIRIPVCIFIPAAVYFLVYFRTAHWKDSVKWLKERRG